MQLPFPVAPGQACTGSRNAPRQNAARAAASSAREHAIHPYADERREQRLHDIARNKRQRRHGNPLEKPDLLNIHDRDKTADISERHARHDCDERITAEADLLPLKQALGNFSSGEGSSTCRTRKSKAFSCEGARKRGMPVASPAGDRVLHKPSPCSGARKRGMPVASPSGDRVSGG
jgi:hypothetical protein